ncbi:exodeoxyribonuclease VII large subunit [Blastomonas fulva]|uniref:exodeoxyribonuclease VII large subunit n=1 Tax=Blastomonas fulva TaxID=1550728 RepID=UPI0025A4114B|nr:exodeoxyribonuclease VII large subunit [Blastomonas fulva]MDM7928983.1 exodeoxyribonuclease VII large subunit [Blastomonas fulva]MDM7965826.1 exodeoxyribonuclease VII large subunit [Blastomonas fulva]
MPDPFLDDANSRSGGLLAQMAPGDNAPPLSVSEISNLLKRTVEDRFGHVRIRGEISGFKRAASGHCYLALKDDKALIDGIIWKGTAQRLNFAPEDGLDVIATGKLTTFPGRSKYQITIESLELAGEGALMQLFEKLKARLAGEGLFDPARKRALPFLPRTIGVVTSPTGSVIRDILHRLADRFPSHVLVWPVLVQGEGAAAQVAAAVRGFSAMPEDRRPDLLIVARGGGSIEDLWAFNEEPVVRAIAESGIPVISAVGHETDTTLADFAADRRAPTPTAAAEMAVPVRADLLAGLGELGLRATRAINRTQGLARERLESRAQRLPKLQDLLSPQQQRADDLGERLRAALGLRLADARGTLARASGALRPAVLDARAGLARERLSRLRLDPAMLERIATRAGERLAGLERVLAQLDPDAPLQRGYARVTAADGRTLLDRASAQREPSLALHFRDGVLDVVPADGPVPPPPRTPPAAVRPKPQATEPRQSSLF